MDSAATRSIRGVGSRPVVPFKCAWISPDGRVSSSRRAWETVPLIDTVFAARDAMGCACATQAHCPDPAVTAITPTLNSVNAARIVLLLNRLFGLRLV